MILLALIQMTKIPKRRIKMKQKIFKLSMQRTNVHNKRIFHERVLEFEPCMTPVNTLMLKLAAVAFESQLRNASTYIVFDDSNTHDESEFIMAAFHMLLDFEEISIDEFAKTRRIINESNKVDIARRFLTPRVSEFTRCEIFDLSAYEQMRILSETRDSVLSLDISDDDIVKQLVVYNLTT